MTTKIASPKQKRIVKVTKMASDILIQLSSRAPRLLRRSPRIASIDCVMTLVDLHRHDCRDKDPSSKDR